MSAFSFCILYIEIVCREIIMRICDLKNKEVINSNDCKILGFVVDIDVDLYTGRVISIIVPGPGGYSVSLDARMSMLYHMNVYVKSDRM